MENSGDKERSYTEKSRQEERGASSQPSTSTQGTKRKKKVQDDQASCPKKKSEATNSQKCPKKISVPPLPLELPPINFVHRDVLRAWCQQLHLSSKGQKLDTYKRLCDKAYPQQKNIPITANETRMSIRSNLKADKRKKPLGSSKKRTCSVGTTPLEVVPSPEELPVLEEPPALYEEVSTSMVMTSAPEEVLGSWDTDAASAMQAETVQSPPETHGVRWCVVHGRSLPADKSGWVQLQFHAGQAWVPEKKKGKVSALFLLPSCSFPPQHLEDNLLCPKCVKRNKTLINSLRWV
ncbi:developmental pluripotency-associated protein 4 [Callospermophilus lateralis]|uniref:developmental pluripotency-associated protein 4 n=1 Tax=Callospermophilus lateralis TaxID=76772 RepID=UPI004038DD1E